MEFKKFFNGAEMYEYVCSGNDLYSKSLRTYVFVYNDAGALCVYTLEPEEIVELIELGKKNSEYWGAFLGWKGSEVLDEAEFDNEEYRYSDDENKRRLYLGPSLEFCDVYFCAEDWLDTDDVTKDYVLT